MDLEIVNKLIKTAKDSNTNKDKNGIDLHPAVVGTGVATIPALAQAGATLGVFNVANSIGSNKTNFYEQKVDDMMARAGYGKERKIDLNLFHNFKFHNLKQQQYRNSADNNSIYVNFEGKNPIGNSTGPYAGQIKSSLSDKLEPHIFIPKNSGKLGNMGSFAHELGHAIGMNKNSILQNQKVSLYSQATPLASSIANGMSEAYYTAKLRKTTDPKEREKINERANSVGKGLAIAGTAAALPLLGRELEASYRGAKLMPKGIGNKLKPFVGIPSYLGAIAIPGASYALGKKYREQLPAPNTKEGKN